MKKLLALCLTAVLCLCCLASCVATIPHAHTEGDVWEYNENQHWKPINCVFNICEINIVSYEHVDENNDGVCDVCGYLAKIGGAFEFEYVGTEEGHCEHKVGTTCDGTCVKSPHENYDADLFCDFCGFNMLEIPTPTNHFLRNQAGCEWLNEITAEDIAEIKIISGAVGVAPGNLNNISSSTDEAVIARIFEEYYWLDTAPISKMEGQIDGGGGVTVKFILKDGTAKELYINNGNYLNTNGDYFELLYVPKFEETDNATKAYGFITYLGTGTVYDKDNNPVCEIPMDEFEFVVFSGLDAVITGYYYRVETEFGTLWFDSSNDVFYLRFNEVEVDYREYREYYQLIGKNLDELIAEYSTTTE